MEDKQPATSDLTSAAADEETQADPTVDGATVEATTDATESTTSSESSDETVAEEAVDETAADEPDDAVADGAADNGAVKKGRVKKRHTGRWIAAAVALLTALFVAAGAFAGATVQPYLAQRANVEIKLKVARAAANAITTLWTYTPENMETLSDRAATYLTGDFGAQYRKYIDQIVAPNKQAKVTNHTDVTGVAVETLKGQDATVIVYTNTTTTSPLTKNIPALKYLAYLLTMKNENDRWKVVRMNTITSLDVTPHL